MLGDTPYDVEAARRTGVRLVGVESGGWRRADLAGAVEVYATPADLYERYDRSVFGRVGSWNVNNERAPVSQWAIDARVVALVAAGLAGVALLALTLRALARRRARVVEEPVHEPRPGLTARDRERLRHLIEHTS